MGNVGTTQISVALEQYLHRGLVVGLPCSIESKENRNGYFKRKKKYIIYIIYFKRKKNI